jgi:integrase
MSLRFKDGKGILDYYEGGRESKRVRKTIRAATIEEAEQLAADWLESVRQLRKIRVPASPSATINDLMADHLEWVDLKLRPSTASERHYTVEHIKRILGSVRVREISPAHVQLYQTARKKQGVTNKTVNKEIYYLCSFLRWCRETAAIDVPPLKVSKLRYDRPVPVVLSPDEVVRIIDAAEGMHKPFFLILYTLGLRFSEASNLKWDDIDFENRLIRTQQKGGSYKVLPLNDWLEQELKALGDPVKGERVFKSRIRGKRVVNVRKALAAACEKAKVGKRVYPHLFRHSVATHFLGEDVNLRKIQAYLGHKEIETTEFYTHVVAADLGKAANDLFAKMNPVTTPKGPEP